MADILEEIGDLSVPGNREQAVARIKALENSKRQQAVEEAQKRGLPIGIVRPDGVVQEVAGFDDGQR